MKTLALVCVLALSFVASCSAPPRRLGLAAAEVAELRCRDYGFKLIPLGFDAVIGVKKLDGEELSAGFGRGLTRIVEVLPGPHTVEVSYITWIDGVHGPSGEETIALNAAAGEVIEFDVELTAGGGARVIYADKATAAKE